MKVAVKNRIKKSLLWTAMFLLAATAALTCGKSVLARSEGKRVDVMFIHDLHSHLNAFSTMEDGEPQVVGGVAQMMTLISEQKAENPHTLLLDAGDFSMGTLIQVVYEEEASELRMLGEMGFDATTFGNHEFDYKAQGLADMLNNALESGDTLPPVLVCNVDWEGMKAKGLTGEQQLLWEAFENYGVKDYIVVEKGDVRIAVIGVFGVNALACVPNPPLEYQEPVLAVQETVAEIQAKETVDMIVCISHSGTWADESKSEDEILAKSVPQLDLIISGHSHTKLEEPIVHGDTHIVSVAEYGKYLGNLSMTQKDNGRWTMEDYEIIPVDANVASDEATQRKVDELMTMVDSKYLEQFGFTKDQVLCTNRVEFPQISGNGEFNLGSIMADSYTYTVEKLDTKDSHPVDVAVVPSGTIRDTYTRGNITTEKVFNSFSLGIGEDGNPGYPLISVYLTGAELKIVAEIDASISPLMTTARLYADGLYWHFNPNRMILNKVTDVYLCNGNEERVELEDEKLYRVVTDYYSSQMLGGVTDMSYGILSIVPKFADGTPIEHYEDAVIVVDGKELKAWVAIATYMNEFADTDGDGIGEVPAKYAALEGRKVVEESKNFLELIKNPNKFFFLIIGVIVLVVLILVVLIILIKKLVVAGYRKVRRKQEKRKG